MLVLVVVVGSSSFLLCHRRACWKWIRQSEWMRPQGLGEGRVLRAGLAWVPALPCPPRLPEAGISSPPPGVVSELHLCYPVQTFRPKPEPAGKCQDVQRGCSSHMDM